MLLAENWWPVMLLVAPSARVAVPTVTPLTVTVACVVVAVIAMVDHSAVDGSSAGPAPSVCHALPA